jgi:hypothetical protein
MMAEFDTFLIGRKTFEAMMRMGSDAQRSIFRNSACTRRLARSGLSTTS